MHPWHRVADCGPALKRWLAYGFFWEATLDGLLLAAEHQWMPADSDLPAAAFDPQSAPWPVLDTTSIHLWLLPYQRGDSSLGALRDCIARYCGIESGQVDLDRDPAGKPWLRAPKCNLRFSASHSGAQLVLAFLRGAADGDLIGVDLETTRPRPRTLELARRFFSSEEADALAALPVRQQELAFYRFWVAKEAVLKALGRGLAHGLDKVSFALEGDLGELRQAEARLRLVTLEVPPSPAHNESVAQTLDAAIDSESSIAAWKLHEFAVDQAIGCIAWRGAPRRIVLFKAAKPATQPEM
ncbi:MAG: 4'-phosphopantetheinyl transferase superfamily protein [Lysobacteraceae bacterium]